MDKTTLRPHFRPFYSTKKRGTGLGLAMWKQIVEQHKGTIQCGEQAGEGTRFIIDPRYGTGKGKVG